MDVVIRRVGETIRISPEITLTILEIRGNEVRFAISAPAGSQIETSGFLRVAEPEVETEDREETGEDSSSEQEDEDPEGPPSTH